MPNKCDHNIYGCDENAYAEAVWSQALGSPGTDSTAIQADAVSVGSKGKRLDGSEDAFPIAKEPNPEAVVMGNKGDGRAKSKGN